MAGFVAFEIARPKLTAEATTAEIVRAMRIAILTIVLGVPFVLDDPSEEMVASAPTRLSVRRALRVALVAPVLIAAWWVLVSYARWKAELASLQSIPGESGVDIAIPVWGLWREFVTLVVAAFALSASGTRFIHERIGSVVAGPALLAIAGATLFLPASVTLFPGDPAQPAWAHARDRWAIAFAVALLWLWHVSRDAGRPSWRARLRNRRRRGGTEAVIPALQTQRDEMGIQDLSTLNKTERIQDK